MKKISEKLSKGAVLVSDGAWGTALMAQGLKPGEAPELWNVDHREKVLSVAKSYVDAGSNLIETNSFGGSSIKLAQAGAAERAYELNKAAAEISREATGDDVIVLGSVGPTGKFLMMGEVTEEELYESFKEQAQALEAGGADAICIETMYDLDEARIAVKAARENTALEIVCTFAFEKQKNGDNRTMMGLSPEDAVAMLKEMDVDVIGANCGRGFEQMIDIVKQIKSAAPDKPVLIHANAGDPQTKDGAMHFPETPEIAAKIVPDIINAGASIIGGCCGTTPEHIRAIVKSVS